MIGKKNVGGKDKILEVFGERALDYEVESNRRGEKQIQTQILSEMMSIDPERALTAMKSWATFVRLAAGRARSVPFTNMEEYLPYRIIDAGEL